MFVVHDLRNVSTTPKRPFLSSNTGDLRSFGRFLKSLHLEKSCMQISKMLCMSACIQLTLIKPEMTTSCQFGILKSR